MFIPRQGTSNTNTASTAYAILMFDIFCQSQGPTPGQVRSGQTKTPTPIQKWDLSHTLKLVFTTHPPPPLTPSLNECLERRVLSKSCQYHHYGPQKDQG